MKEYSKLIFTLDLGSSNFVARTKEGSILCSPSKDEFHPNKANMEIKDGHHITAREGIEELARALNDVIIKDIYGNDSSAFNNYRNLLKSENWVNRLVSIIENTGTHNVRDDKIRFILTGKKAFSSWR